MIAEVQYQVYGSCFSYVGHVEAKNKKELRSKSKEVMRLSGNCGYTGFKGITIKLIIVDSNDIITFDPHS